MSFNEALHPRDLRGRWAEKLSARLPGGDGLVGPGWAERFTEQTLADNPGLKLFVSGGGGKPVVVHSIVVPKSDRSRGTGGRVMRRLLEIADRNGDTVALTPSSDFGGSKPRLVKWYKSLGFVDNKGRGRDLEISETMYRLPQGARR